MQFNTTRCNVVEAEQQDTLGWLCRWRRRSPATLGALSNGCLSDPILYLCDESQLTLPLVVSHSSRYHQQILCVISQYHLLHLYLSQHSRRGAQAAADPASFPQPIQLLVHEAVFIAIGSYTSSLLLSLSALILFALTIILEGTRD